MTLWRRAAPTIVWVSLLASLVGTGVTLTLTLRYVLAQLTEHITPFAALLRDDTFSSRCQAEPSGFSQTLPDGDRVTAYDLTNLAAPPAGPDPAMLKEIRAGARSATRVFLFRRFGGSMLMRVADGGPCSLIEVQWRIAQFSRIRKSLMGLALATLTALLTGVLSALMVVRPLIARVQRLGRAAREMGTGYISAADDGEDELGALSSVLDGANARIQAATEELVERHRRLEVHLADVAHDLKTPLTSVQLALEEAARGEAGVDVSALARRCLDDCVHLAAMVDNLRVGTELSEGLDPAADGARSELGEVVQQVVRRLSPLSRYRGVELDMARPDGEVWCGCRSLALERVIGNLVHNAVSHGRAGDHVAVLLEVAQGEFRLTVLDDGPGMAQEELAAVRERRFRGSNAEQRAPGGTGLGLAIVAEVCRRCGWTLTFEANAPTGLRVEVRGPALHSSSKVAL